MRLQEKAGKFHVAMGPNCIRDSQYWGGPVLKLTRSYPQPPKISKKEKAEQSKGGALEPASASKRESKRLEEDESESRLSRILCKHCCFRSETPAFFPGFRTRTPSAVFHFEDLEPLGVAAYSKRFGERVKKEEKEVKEEVKVKEEPDETLRSVTS